MKNQTCCFTGHRKMPLGEIKVISERLREEIIKLIDGGVVYFGAGGALGFDTLAAKTVIDLRESYPQIRLILVLPCRNQTKGWPAADVAVYHDILARADKAVYTAEAYYDGCMMHRNRHLVDSSDFCIAYLTESFGGTFKTVEYAKQKGLRVVKLSLG